MSRFLATSVALLLATGLVGAASAQTTAPSGEIEIRTRQGVWQPAADGEQIPLWPDGTDLLRPDTGDAPEETGNGSALVAGRPWNWAGNVTQPTLTLYHPTGPNTGGTLLVIPGGGFSVVAMDLEGTEICDWAVELGMTCAILKYRAPQRWPWDQAAGDNRRPEVLLALQDAQRAMGLLRENADAYGVDPHRIGVIGFSAGAYLVADLSNAGERTYASVDAADRQSARPDFAIVAYTGRLWLEGSGNDLRLAPWVTISPDAPPTLLIHAMDDPVDNIRHPMAYALALHEAGVPVDVRFYARGGHAYGMRPTSAPITTQWPGQAAQWLRDLGILPTPADSGN